MPTKNWRLETIHKLLIKSLHKLYFLNTSLEPILVYLQHIIKKI